MRDAVVDVQRFDDVLAALDRGSASRARSGQRDRLIASMDEVRAPLDGILREQLDYYEARAHEYEDVWYRRGRYDLGKAGNAAWIAETAKLDAAVDAACMTGEVLELACGTGVFTKRLVRSARRLTALDAAAAVLEINAASIDDPRVIHQRADVFTWEPPDGRRYDHIFFGFFLSHIPPHRAELFWDRLRRWLAPGGRVWFCDDAPGVETRPSNPGEVVTDGPAWTHRRTLHDGRAFTIVKVCYAPDALTSWLATRGWRADISATGQEFIFGSATRL